MKLRLSNFPNERDLNRVTRYTDTWEEFLEEVKTFSPFTLLSFAGENSMFFDGQDFWVAEMDSEDFQMIGEAEFLPDNEFVKETFESFKKGHSFNKGFSDSFQESQL